MTEADRIARLRPLSLGGGWERFPGFPIRDRLGLVERSWPLARNRRHFGGCVVRYRRHLDAYYLGSSWN